MASFFFFDVRKVVVIHQGSRLRWCWEFARCRSSSIRRTCCLMSPWWTCRERPLSKADACRFHWMVCTIANELSLQLVLLEDCKDSQASSTRDWPFQSFLTRFIGHGHFWFATVCFRAWFSFGTEFFLSASASRSVLLPFFFLSVVHACASCRAEKKSDTARCHWQWDVNVIRCPLPQTTGRTSECLHASSWSKCMRDVTEHVGTKHIGPCSGPLTCPKVQSNKAFVRPLAVDLKAPVAIRANALRLAEEETALAARWSSSQDCCSAYMI